ncbi:hypothetical protein U2F26_15005 [Micromonospora sp. 4G57]|uniref:Uncharacterized protein n=1 Tax=Micromonospora sicca TaxID=2202420 RepID=A0ABU5JGZ1_9ACTN|nr:MULTISPECIES: hypothetical protein [unclassified Micromonospora]MDZ5444032.1 hypothetical protein [Micromonospora sp. 4G57]MDZ5491841.1 hypothetical protein [Micromonospora sp. 4G53]
MIEEMGSPMSSDDLYRVAAMDAKMLQDRILSAAGSSIDVSDGRVAALALASALLAVVQEYLERTSDEHDVALFLEVNGRQPDDVASWPVNILAGLRLRRTPADDWHSMCQRAVQIAVRRLRPASGS